ncbi:MAG: 5'/3'-nucleotidase SurE, partial [Bdellovibrionales bacterium]|nr:5'/3'-nucleotidase SurE [Bdellovibrionales bacterium]
MKKYKILISNDDGPASPLLVPFIKAVKALPICSEVRIVVPAKERSWIAKALTRFDPLTVTPHTFGDLPGFTVSGSGALGGTPADCVSLGINNLYRDPPNLVLSGINMGNNAGL